MNDDDRPTVYVHTETRSDDPVRTFYEIPEQIARDVHARAVLDDESFVSCLLSVVLEREGALGEVARLKRITGGMVTMIAIEHERQRIIERIVHMADVTLPDDVSRTKLTIEKVAYVLAVELGLKP